MNQIMKYIPGLAVLLIVGCIAFYFYNRYSVAPTIQFDQISLSDINGKPLKFKDFTGKKTIVCFSASWCPNCLEELREINRIKESELADIDVIVISDEPLEKISSFRDRTQYPFIFLKLQTSFNQIGINSIPTSYLLNSKQEVKKETVGYLNWGDASTRAHLKKLMD